MALYQEIRPQSFDELFGNKETIKSLKKLLKQPNHPHTYLFIGERGTGKTTTARIMAKELGCSDIDFTELNGSDNRGIDDARYAIMLANTSPIAGKCRVILYDEAHKLTNEAQNSLLKILEDTPEKTYFILCSTEPEKLLKTIRSRCTIYRFELLNDEIMEGLIESVLAYLDKDLDDDIFFGIIDNAGGSPRDALVLLEQIISLETKEEQLKFLKSTQVEHEVVELCRLLLKGGSWKSVVEIYNGIKDTEPETIRRSILGYMKVVMLKETNLEKLKKVYSIISIFEKNLYDSGDAGLVKMLFESVIS